MLDPHGGAAHLRPAGRIGEEASLETDRPPLLFSVAGEWGERYGENQKEGKKYEKEGRKESCGNGNDRFGITF